MLTVLLFEEAETDFHEFGAGSMVDPSRQEHSHAHQATFSPDSKHLYIVGA
jgi:hypothetical protein